MAFPTYTFNFANNDTVDGPNCMQNWNDILNGVSDGTKDLKSLSISLVNSTFNTKLASSATSTWTLTFPTGVGTTSQVLTYGTPTTWSSVQGNATLCKAPTVQVFASTGTQTGWAFTVTAANATVGATYTNNTNTYTVLGTISAGTLLFMSGTGATSGGTLTKSTGSGDATITFSSKVASATYTTPTSPGPIVLKVRGIGGGSGGAGSGTSGAGNSTAGNPTYFGSNMLSGGGAGVATAGYAAGATGGAGTATGTGVTSILTFTGGSGSGSDSSISTTYNKGGGGGVGPFGGAGGGGQAGAAGINASTNSGAGGGGGGSNNVATDISGAGGAAGGYFEAYISTPAATYPYVIGTGGAKGSAGTNGFAGGDGAAGIVVIEEWYQ